MLCAVCQDIFACKAPATATVSPFGKFTEYISFTRAPHRSLDGFLSSARQKCFICYLLLERACESYGFREPELSVGGEDSNAGEFSVVSLGTTRFTTDAVEQKAPALNVGVSIRAGAFGDQRKTDVAVGFQIWPPGDSMQNPAPEKNVAMTCTDENRKAQGRKWFHECSATHPCGRHRDANFRPTRLVEVLSESQDQHPEWRVVVANETPEVYQHEYATLSHRWPASGMVSLTQKSLSSFSSPQAEGKLPGRWQQALGMARILQIRYVWIDSLCIIQDSVEDWRKESLMMDKVYQNSTLTFLLTTPPYDTLPLVHEPYSSRFMRCFVQFNLMHWLEGIRASLIIRLPRD